MPKMVVNAPDKLFNEIKDEANELDLLMGEYVRTILREREKIPKYDFAVENDLLDEEALEEKMEEASEEDSEESEEDSEEDEK